MVYYPSLVPKEGFIKCGKRGTVNLLYLTGSGKP